MEPNSNAKEHKVDFLVLLINLDSRPDRLEECVLEGNRSQIHFTRVPAVDTKSSEISSNSLISPPAFACLKSHLKCYETLLNSEFPFALILEDDFKVLSPQEFTKTLDSASWSGFDLIQFGFLYMDLWHRLDIWNKRFKDTFFKLAIYLTKMFPYLDKLTNGKLEIQKRLNVPSKFIVDDLRSGSHGYLISRQMAQQILMMKDCIYLPIDGFLGTLQYTNKFKLLRIRKSMLGQRKSRSDIK